MCNYMYGPLKVLKSKVSSIIYECILSSIFDFPAYFNQSRFPAQQYTHAAFPIKSNDNYRLRRRKL